MVPWNVCHEYASNFFKRGGISFTVKFLSPALIREVASDLTSNFAGSIRRERYMYVHVALARKIAQFISFHNEYFTFNESQLDRK